MQKSGTSSICQANESTFEVHFKFNHTQINCLRIKLLLLSFSFSVLFERARDQRCSKTIKIGPGVS